METFEARYARFITERALIAIVLPLLIVSALGTGIRHLTFDSDYRSYFKPDNPDLLAWDALSNTFGESNSLMLILAPRDGDVFTRGTLSAVEYLTKQAWQIPYATRVDSLSNYQHTRADGNNLLVADLVTNAHHLSDTALEEIRKVALAERLLLHRLISPDGSVTGLSIRLPIDTMVDATVAYAEITAELERINNEFEHRYPNIDMYTGGEVMLDISFMTAAKRDARTLLPASALLMAVLLTLLLRSTTATALTMLVIALSVIGAIGLRGHSGVPLTGQSGSVPIIIMTVAIANCVHVLVSFIHKVNVGNTKQAALQESLRINLHPVFIASLTTTLGFLTLNTAAAPPMAWMGNTVAAGVVIAFFLSVTLLPGALSLLSIKPKRRTENDQQWLEGLGYLLIRKTNAFLLASSLVIILLCSLVPLNEIETNPFDFFDRSFEVRRATDFLSANLSGPVIINYQLSSKTPGGIADPEFLADAEMFAEWLRTQPEVVQVSSLTDTLKRLNANMHQGNPRWYKLPSERDMTAQYLLLYEMSLPYGLDLNDQIDVSRSSIKTVAALNQIDGKYLLAFEQRVQEWLTDNVIHLRGKGQGQGLMFHNLAHMNITSLLWGSVMALTTISLLLVFAFRSLKFGLLSLLPNLVPAAMGFGVWALVRGKVGLDISMVIGMTLGIVVDDTVHFISKYLRARRENDMNSEQAIVYAFSTVGKALLVTSLVLVAGFVVVSMSGFAFNSRMAELTSMVIVFALVVDFFFLPTLLMKVDSGTRNVVTS